MQSSNVYQHSQQHGLDILRPACHNQSLQVRQQQIQLRPTNAIDNQSFTNMIPTFSQNEDMAAQSIREGDEIQLFSNLALGSTPFYSQHLNQLEARMQSFWEQNTQFISIFQLYLSNLSSKQTDTKQIPKLKISKLRSNKKQCAICYQIIKKDSKVPSLKCKHKFHKKCLQKWMQEKASCPLCRDHIL